MGAVLVIFSIRIIKASLSLPLLSLRVILKLLLPSVKASNTETLPSSPIVAISIPFSHTVEFTSPLTSTVILLSLIFVGASVLSVGAFSLGTLSSLNIKLVIIPKKACNCSSVRLSSSEGMVALSIVSDISIMPIVCFMIFIIVVLILIIFN